MNDVSDISTTTNPDEESSTTTSDSEQVDKIDSYDHDESIFYSQYKTDEVRRDVDDKEKPNNEAPNQPNPLDQPAYACDSP